MAIVSFYWKKEINYYILKLSNSIFHIKALEKY
jgi:hypothetical protein